MQNKILKITRMGFALVILAFGALPALAQDCEGWVDEGKSFTEKTAYAEIITPEQIKACLDNGVDVNAIDKDGRTLLHWTANNNKNPKVIMVLLDAGADIHARDNWKTTPLDDAASWNENPKVIIALLDAGADVRTQNNLGFTPLHGAAWWHKDPRIITILLDAGADVNARGKGGQTPLHLAKAPKMIMALLNAGADIHTRAYDGGTPLHWAARYNKNPKVIAILLDAGVKANINKRAENGWALINWIVALFSIVESDVHLEDNEGATPLHWTAKSNTNPEIIIALLQDGADVNAKDNKDRTPLHWAALGGGNLEVIMALIKSGADGKITDYLGDTPFELANENQFIKDTKAYWVLSDAQF